MESPSATQIFVPFSRAIARSAVSSDLIFPWISSAQALPITNTSSRAPAIPNTVLIADLLRWSRAIVGPDPGHQPGTTTVRPRKRRASTRRRGGGDPGIEKERKLDVLGSRARLVAQPAGVANRDTARLFASTPASRADI